MVSDFHCPLRAAMMLFGEVARHDCAGNCEFESVATFAGGEWQFVADHCAAIDAHGPGHSPAQQRSQQPQQSGKYILCACSAPTSARSGLVKITTDSSYPRLQRHATMLHIVFSALHGR